MQLSAPSCLYDCLMRRSVSAIATRDNLVRQNLKPKRIRRVYNGLDPNIFERYDNPASRELLRKEFHIRADQPVIGIIGNVDYWKGQIVVVKAIEMVKGEIPRRKMPDRG